MPRQRRTKPCSISALRCFTSMIVELAVHVDTKNHKRWSRCWKGKNVGREAVCITSAISIGIGPLIVSKHAMHVCLGQVRCIQLHSTAISRCQHQSCFLRKYAKLCWKTTVALGTLHPSHQEVCYSWKEGLMPHFLPVYH